MFDALDRYGDLFARNVRCEADVSGAHEATAFK